MRILLILFIIFFKTNVFGQIEEVIDSASSESILIPAHYTECYSKDFKKINHCTYSKLFRFIRMNYEMPDKARELGLSGKSLIGFQVDKLGTIDSVYVIESSGESVLDSAAVSCIEKLPAMHPAVNYDGDSILIKYRVPIKIDIIEN